MRSCIIRPVDARGRSRLLMRCSMCVEGVFLSTLISSSPLLVFLQLSFHLFLISVLNACFTVEGLIGSFRLSVLGSNFVSELSPAAAFLASLSASSLPGIPECPAVQHMVIEKFLLLLLFFIIFPCLSISRAM